MLLLAALVGIQLLTNMITSFVDGLRMKREERFIRRGSGKAGRSLSMPALYDMQEGHDESSSKTAASDTCGWLTASTRVRRAWTAPEHDGIMNPSRITHSAHCHA